MSNFKIFMRFFASIIIIILVLIPDFTFSQSYILEKLDFDHGKWKLFGISEKRGRHHPTLVDSLGNFFSDDIELLKEIQRTWKWLIPGF